MIVFNISRNVLIFDVLVRKREQPFHPTQYR
jgi:hypothetical protein